MKRKNILITLMFSAVIATVVGIGFWFASGYDIMKVAGVSMSPTISHGDYVIVDMRGKPKDLDVVIVDISSISGLENDLFIKRYYEDYSTDGLYIIGDNASNSYDSRLIGEVPKECLKGVVVFNLSKWLESVGIR